MASITLHQALTTQQQEKIKLLDLDNMVTWVAQYALEAENDSLSFIFKTGMPGQFPNGEWGFTVVGDSGMHIIPDPDPLDHRTSFRYAEIPRHEVKLKSLWGVMAPMTIYERKLRLEVKNGEVWKAIQLKALEKALPNYFRYLSFSIFAGAKNKLVNKPVLRDYIATYIEPSDGAANGYKFYNSEGYGEINLNKVIANQKVTEHALKTELARINQIIYKDSNKIEAKKATWVAKKKWIGQNMVPESQNTLAVYYEAQRVLRKIIADKVFEHKYKVDTTKFEGYNAPVKASDLIIILNRQEWIDLHNDFNFTNLGKASLGEDFFQGARVLFNDDIDQNVALIVHKDLLQFWILPSETRFIEIPYEYEETKDFMYMTRHTMDVVPIFSTCWIEFKAD